MNILELYAGTRSIGKAFEKKGHHVLSVDYDTTFDNVVHMNVADVTVEWVLENLGIPDVIWASPDCTTYSIAGISNHRVKNDLTGELDPVSDYAIFCDQLNEHVNNVLIPYFTEKHNTIVFIENPRGVCVKCHLLNNLYNTLSHIVNMVIGV